MCLFQGSWRWQTLQTDRVERVGDVLQTFPRGDGLSFSHESEKTEKSRHRDDQQAQTGRQVVPQDQRRLVSKKDQAFAQICEIGGKYREIYQRFGTTAEGGPSFFPFCPPDRHHQQCRERGHRTAGDVRENFPQSSHQQIVTRARRHRPNRFSFQSFSNEER